MYSRIPLMNLAANFVPNGAKIISADDDPGKIGFRADNDSVVVIVEYTYRSNPYTMVLENIDGEWKIVDIYDSIGELEVSDYSRKEGAISKNQKAQRVLPSIQIDGGYLWDEEIGDVTGDKLLDRVYVVAINPRDESEFADDVKIIIKDGKTEARTEIKVPSSSGYRPSIELRDVRGNGIKDIVFSMFATGSGENTYIYIYSFEDGKVKTLFNYDDFNNKNKFTVTYINGYKVKVISEFAKKEYTIDISDKCPSYLNPIYKSDGTVKGQLKGAVSNLTAMYPIDVYNNNIYSLMGFNKIVGLNLLDVLGQIQTYLRWNGREFVAYSQYSMNPGDELGVPKKCEE